MTSSYVYLFIIHILAIGYLYYNILQLYLQYKYLIYETTKFHINHNTFIRNKQMINHMINNSYKTLLKFIQYGTYNIHIPLRLIQDNVNDNNDNDSLLMEDDDIETNSLFNQYKQNDIFISDEDDDFLGRSHDTYFQSQHHHHNHQHDHQHGNCQHRSIEQTEITSSIGITSMNMSR